MKDLKQYTSLLKRNLHWYSYNSISLTAFVSQNYMYILKKFLDIINKDKNVVFLVNEKNTGNPNFW